MKNWILGAILTLAIAGGVYIEHYEDGNPNKGLNESGIVIVIGGIMGVGALMRSSRK